MIKIYTDGACSRNGTDRAKAGWAFAVIQNGRVVHHESGTVIGKQTSNTGELTAIQRALYHAIGMGIECCTLFSDSKYSINSLTIWNIEKKIKGQFKKNYDLIKEIQTLLKDIDCEFEWVEGHSGDTWNEFVDRAANDETYS